MLSDSKTATGTVTFALTDSPTLSMDMNFAVKGTEHTTYLGVTQEAKISNTSNVLKVNLTKEQTVTITITVSYAYNILIVPESITTAQNKTLSKISNENGVAIYKTADGVTASNSDYIVLDNLLSAIYPTVDASNKNYSIKIETQAGNSAPASAILSGAYTNTTTQYDVTFNVVGGEYGTITGTGIFADFNSSSTNTYAVPHGTTTRVNDSTITFIDPYDNELGTLTAQITSQNTEDYTYTFNWGTVNGTINGETNVEANFVQESNGYKVNFYNADGTKLLQVVTVKEGESAKFTGQIELEEGYIFDGWVESIGSTTPISLDNITSNMDVYMYSRLPKFYFLTIVAHREIIFYKDDSAYASGDYTRLMGETSGEIPAGYIVKTRITLGGGHITSVSNRNTGESIETTYDGTYVYFIMPSFDIDLE